MTDTSGATVAAGWYTDPAGSGHLRWWDGAAWTAHLAPAPTPTVQVAEVEPVQHYAPVVETPSVVTADNQPYVPFQGSWNNTAQASAYSMGAASDFARPAQWNTTGAWLLAFSAILIPIALFISVNGVSNTSSTAYQLGRIVGASLVPYLISLVCAELDRRKLRSLGYLRIPSLWWMLLAPPLVYLIVRTVYVRSEVGRGIGPLIASIVVNVAVGVGTAVGAAVIAANLVGAGSSAQFAASLQTGLNEKGGPFTVTCPLVLPKPVGSTFTCRAVDAAGVVHVLTIQVTNGTDGKTSDTLISVTPPIAG